MAHTGCGMQSFTDDEFIAELADTTGQPPTWRPGTFTDPVRHVRHGMQQLHTSPFLLADTTVRGFVFNMETGAVDEVEAADPEAVNNNSTPIPREANSAS
jgi:carbonic anhydrase